MSAPGASSARQRGKGKRSSSGSRRRQTAAVVAATNQVADPQTHQAHQVTDRPARPSEHDAADQGTNQHADRHAEQGAERLARVVPHDEAPGRLHDQ